jgi:microcystin-dependent protein
MKRYHIFTLIIFCALSCLALAQQPDSVPKLINYQGKLTNAEGLALQNGNYEVRFTLWDAASGGNLVWGEDRTITLVGGVFNVALGGAGSTPVAGAGVNDIAYAFGSKNRFLETTILSGPGLAGEQTLAPRQQMVSVPFAFQSNTAEEATNSAKLAGQEPSFWVPTGTIVAYGGEVAPPGWLLCDGQAILREGLYATLFATIGTRYGNGNGLNTFNVPNALGLVLRGTGSRYVNGRTKTGPALGEAQEDQFQGHRHSIFRNNVKGLFGAFNNGGYLLDGGDHNPSYTAGVYNTSVRDSITDGVNGNPRIGSETRVSSLGVNYIIKY